MCRRSETGKYYYLTIEQQPYCFTTLELKADPSDHARQLRVGNPEISPRLLTPPPLKWQKRQFFNMYL